VRADVRATGPGPGQRAEAGRPTRGALDGFTLAARTWVKNLYSVFGHPPNSASLEVTIADWPGLGGGLEASAYKRWTDCNAADVEWDADE
jgi:hypothetical protein